MRGLFATAAAVFCAAGLTGFGGSVATAAERAVLPPAGEICVYAGTTPIGGGHCFFGYGVYGLANLVGDHLVSDNPAGVAVFRLCTGYGTGCTPPLSAGDHIIDMTPYSSLLISRS